MKARPLKVLLAPDSFKGSLSASQAAHYMAAGITDAVPEAVCLKIPVADGGEGTLEVVMNATAGKEIEASVQDPLGRRITARYGLLPDSKALIEMAQASGLKWLKEDERNPLLTNTYGTGQLIRHALSQGCRHLLLTLGGSATNDGGAGMLQALGVRFIDASGKAFSPNGGNLGQLDRLDLQGLDKRLDQITWILACDVDNPLLGERGATQVYAPQKGALPQVLPILEANLTHFADKLGRELGISGIDQHPGTGSAGGTAFALMALFKAPVMSGIEMVLETIRIKEQIQAFQPDLVITGEGQLDSQTASGKAPLGIARLARQLGIPVIGLAGSLGTGYKQLSELGFEGFMPLVPGPIPLEKALSEAGPLLREAAYRLMQLIELKDKYRMA
jgi:glycerate kinase